MRFSVVRWREGSVKISRRKVFTPESNQVTPYWTYALNTDLDVVHMTQTRYPVSLISANGCAREMDAFLDSSHGIIRVKRLGDLVLHTDSRSASLAIARKEWGVHVLAKQPSAETDQTQTRVPDFVYLTNKRSLKQYYELHRILRGIRGPDVWSRNTAWLRKDPSSFCRTIAKMKFRWESGACGASVALAQEDDSWPRYTTDPKLFACLCARSDDDKLIADTGRFWDAVNVNELKARQRDLRRSREETEPSNESLLDESQENDCTLLSADCQWHDYEKSCSVTSNTRLEIETMYKKPACHDHVFVELLYNQDFRTPLQLHHDGAVTKYYEPYKFADIVHYVYTLAVFGCGLVPVFSYTRDDELLNKTLRLAFGTLALSNRLLGEAQPKKSKIVLIVVN